MAEAEEADAWAVGVGQCPWQERDYFIILSKEWGQRHEYQHTHIHTHNAESSILWPCAHSFSFILTLQIISATRFIKEHTSGACSVLYTGTICQDKINNRLDRNRHDDISPIIHEALFSQIIRVPMERTKWWQYSYCKGLQFIWLGRTSIFHVISSWTQKANITPQKSDIIVFLETLNRIDQSRCADQTSQVTADCEMCKMNWTWITQTLVGFVALLMTI